MTRTAERRTRFQVGHVTTRVRRKIQLTLLALSRNPVDGIREPESTVGITNTVQLHESIVRAFHERRLSYERIAALLGIGRTTLSQVLRRHQGTGDVEATTTRRVTALRAAGRWPIS